MTAFDRFDTDDATLVAFVHDELDGESARAVRAAALRDAKLQARIDALRSVDAALLEALDAPRRGPRRWRAAMAPLLAIAAACIVVVVGWLGFGVARARNDIVELQVAPRGGGSHPLFTEVALDLRWKNCLAAERGKGFVVVPAGPGDLLPALAASHANDVARAGLVPVVVQATFTDPDGRAHPAWLRPRGEPLVVTQDAKQSVLLTDFLWQRVDPPPYLGGKPGERGWDEDFLWAYREAPYGEPRAIPDLPGAWRIELRVVCVPPAKADAWPTFAEPLVATTQVVLTGVASAWGVAHDGMQARLLVATGCRDLDRAPIALQLRNTSGRTRRYNIAGSTIAKIPQPFHFTPFVGEGTRFEAAEPRAGVPLIHSGDDLMRAHPDGAVRTLVFCADYFRPSLAAAAVTDELFVQFHFEASVWLPTDTELWQGKLETGRVPLRALRP